jgi:hypothetical protein
MLPVPAKMSNCPRREPYFSPPFSYISPPTDLICVIFLWIICNSITNIIATKMGQNGAILGQVPHFGPFPLKKISIWGAKKAENQPHQIYFSNPRMIWYHKGSPPVLFWDEKRP